MEGHMILVTGPEIGTQTYEACFLTPYFDEFKAKVKKTLEIFVSHDELEKLKECDYSVFCKEVARRIDANL